jgi:aspartate aminotransferase-like enzyme
MELWNHRKTPATTITNALVLMRRALATLDEIGCPGDIGAHLDLAAARLEEWIEDANPALRNLQDFASGTNA